MHGQQNIKKKIKIIFTRQFWGQNPTMKLIQICPVVSVIKKKADECTTRLFYVILNRPVTHVKLLPYLRHVKFENFSVVI